jgi:5-formyltetrahydrofolate cyclo-ligase
MSEVDDPREAMLMRRVKAELRKRMRGLRKTTPWSALAERSARIVERVESLAALKSARTVALFWPIEERHEVDLRPLDAALRARGVRVAYPAIDPEDGTMRFCFVDDPAELEEQGYGFREPSAAAPRASRGDVDVVLVPALAVDARGHRLGYGAGYYDRTLPAYVPPATAVAVAYDFQLLVELPTSEHDYAVQWVVTDARTLEAAPA